MSEAKLQEGVRAGLSVAEKMEITDEADITRLLEFMIFEFERLASDLRREYFLRVLGDTETTASARLAMLELLTRRD